MAVRVGGLESRAAVALDGDTPIGFAAGTPRMLRLSGHSAPAFVVSFVVVSPAWRKQGLAQRLYDALVGVLAPIGAPILTYAVDESPGMHTLVSAYGRHGFAPQNFSLMQAWGAIRGRSPANVPLVEPPAIAGRLDMDREAMREHLDDAPHAVVLSNGARVTRAWRLTRQGRDPYLLLDLLPDHADSVAIAAAVTEAMAACPEHGGQVVVPHVDGALEPVMRGAGLRRMPGAAYRSWL
nr:GNAT family N-acetyltransferase [Gemmatimonadales bacterium]